MPEFIFKNKLYYNPVEFALTFIGGTWKMPILWRLNQKSQRYSQIKKTLPRVSDKMLTSQLRELEELGLISRKVFAEVPPRVEYTITKEGKKAIPIIKKIREYGLYLMKQNGIKD
ncbi:MAG: helix-turn-helix transcriptional regulator [Melioribacteraceae bacterium]|jgi:DNA-binding HxlR family transcriptional regulator|nr:helix-turn-helix transcriptional regulator [Melioribacteraceae bacterium]